MHTPVISLSLSVYVGLVLDLIAWGRLRARQSELGDIMVGARDGVLLGSCNYALTLRRSLSKSTRFGPT